jgi:hypothetical protein
MTQHQRPLLYIERLETGTKLIKTTLPHGYLYGDIHSQRPDTLNIDFVATEQAHTRQGIASTLLQASLRGIRAVEGGILTQAKFGVINPAFASLLQKNFVELILWYAEESAVDSGTNPIDWTTAHELATSRKILTDSYGLEGKEFPAEFDPGVHALLTFNATHASQWVLPTIIQVDKASDM